MGHRRQRLGTHHGRRAAPLPTTPNEFDPELKWELLVTAAVAAVEGHTAPADECAESKPAAVALRTLLTLPRRFPTVRQCSMPATPLRMPCARTACRYHLAHRAHQEHEKQPTRDCALDVANEGEHTLEEVAVVLGVSKERVRQLEESALTKLRQKPELRRLLDEHE